MYYTLINRKTKIAAGSVNCVLIQKNRQSKNCNHIFAILWTFFVEKIY